MNLLNPREIPPVVVAICGSLRIGSYTRRALEIALQGAQEVGAETRLLDLRDFQLPFCGDEDARPYSEDVMRLRHEVGQAKGIILGTPEYHGSFSGVLKNALDLMDPAEIRGKVIGLVSVSGGALGGSDALAGLRSIGRSLHAWVIPDQVSIATAYNAFSESGPLHDRNLERRLMNIGRKVAIFAPLHTSKEWQALVKE